MEAEKSGQQGETTPLVDVGADEDSQLMFNSTEEQPTVKPEATEGPQPMPLVEEKVRSGFLIGLWLIEAFPWARLRIADF